jgi:TPR repeat protein
MMKKTLVIAAMLLAVSFGAFAQSDDIAEYNRGVEAFRSKDYAKARLHWGKLVAQPYAEAYNNFGFLLYYGMGGEADPVRAAALWRAAAEMKHRESQWHLAVAYEEGKGAPANDVEAYAWYRCAEAGYRRKPAADGDDGAILRETKAGLVRVQARIPEKQRDAAERLAKVYTDLYLTDEK